MLAQTSIPALTRFASLATSPARGEVKIRNHSRDAIRARVMPTPLEKPPSEQDRVTPQAAVEPAFGSIMPNKQKGSGTPAGALVHPPRLTGAARAQRSALACRRSTTALARGTHASQRLSFGPGFAGRGADKRRGFSPPAPCPGYSDAPRAPVIVPAGMMPKPPGSGGDEPPPAGTAPAPSTGVAGWRPFK